MKEDTKDIYIIGAGGFAREVAWLIRRINEVKNTWNIVGFIDANKELLGTEFDGYKVVGDDKYLNSKTGAYCVCAIGSSTLRKKIVSNLTNVRFATLIDPNVQMSSSTKIGEGSIICAGSIITVDGNIGNHVIVNLDCTIGHDANLEDFVTLYPSVNVSGNVHLGECVEMGTGSKIIQGLDVSKNSIVGAGAVVVRNIEEPGTYVGVPAKRIK